MDSIRYSFLQSLVQKIASSRPGAWVFARTLHHLDRIFFKLSSGRITLTGVLSGVPVIILTTTGARSGLPRTLPLLGIRDKEDPNTLVVIASNWGQSCYPAWYFNLKANPHVTGSISGIAKKYIAEEAESEEYERFWQYATETYLGFPLYKQRAGDRRIPIMILRPE